MLLLVESLEYKSTSHKGKLQYFLKVKTAIDIDRIVKQINNKKIKIVLPK